MKEVFIRLPMGLSREEKRCLVLSLRNLIRDQNGSLNGYDIYKTAYDIISSDLEGDIKGVFGIRNLLENIPYKIATAYLGMEGMYSCLKFEIYESKSNVYDSEDLAEAMTKLCEQVNELKEKYGIKVNVNVESGSIELGTRLTVRAEDRDSATEYTLTYDDDLLGQDASKWQPILKDQIMEHNEKIGLDDEPDITNSFARRCVFNENRFKGQPIKKKYRTLCINCRRFFDYTRDDLCPEIGYSEVIPGANARVKCPRCGIYATVEFGG